MRHYTDEELTLHYYGEGSRRGAVEKHLDTCAVCAALYREIAGTLAMIAAPAVPARGDQYGLQVWQRIRHQLPERRATFWSSGWKAWLAPQRLGLAAAAALLVAAAFVAGRVWPRQVAPPAASADARIAREAPQRILLASVADHLDRSERVLTDIMNAPDRGNIATEQQWAEDLLTSSRLYRQDAEDAGEQSVAAVLDDLERSLIEIVHSPSTDSAADLQQIRRRIDAAALLFKVRVMSDELRRRDGQADALRPPASIRKTS